MTSAFLLAAQAGDLDGLVALLADDALAVSDGGAEHHAARRPVVAARIPRFMANLAARLGPDDVISARVVNGQPGIHVERAAATPFALAFSVADGQVHRIWIVINPTKVTTLDAPPIS
ncbi:hypothetical protein KSP35_18670 [Aquihabitans sp. G128]|uniref:hypothetical protein n=1 Tax=Aquihabitans sp. G128 TaxID=2849779 RepID=UPI001C24B45F|nr:hypothetical protein [Aquihabitans sp. G128]QXC60334.1 hypothetical protein KSP35_18670 [Aquihabitans sp. G128]